ncbi:glycoside hydrolase family 16 protein [Actinoplanes sp. NPDC049548]|uniref:glycoside hydrolase family 16 protein n=1 Tax=Actinoplanes sp. NPDC049548 TaxID=3155152 RepID=UPI00343736E3
MSYRAAAMPPARSRTIRFLAVAVVLALIPVGWFTTRMVAGAAVPPAPPGLQLVFSDDFTGPANSAVNGQNWIFDLGHGYPGGAVNWGTGEIENMTNSTANVFQDGQGHLAIKPIKDAAGNWTSARIETKRTDFAAPVGGKLRIEASLQQPNVSGAAATGYWPAFWTMGADARNNGAANWPGIGEWDVMESINGRDSYFQTLHCGVAPGGPCNEFTGLGSGEKPCSGCGTGFHTYAVEYDRSRTPETLKWFFDGQNTFTLSSDKLDATAWNNATHHGMLIILNVAMGGSFPAAFGGGAPTASTRSGVPMLVDYVAVFASGAGDGANPPPATTAPTSRPTAAPPTTPPARPTGQPTGRPGNPPNGQQTGTVAPGRPAGHGGGHPRPSRTRGASRPPV